MEVLYSCCCGFDLHAGAAVACLIEDGKKQTLTFPTMTDDLLRLLDWLTSHGCTHLAIESSGVYRKPVFNILESSMEVILTNARDAKGFKAGKTDVPDAERKKKPELKRALEGRLTENQRWILSQKLNQYDSVEEAIKRVEGKIRAEEEESADPFEAEAVKLRGTIPGEAETAAHVSVSEIGVEMSQFASGKQLASWAGMCPGNNESAGKRRGGKARKGNRYLRAVLVRAAWVASQQEET
jgi:transposase